MSKALMLSMAVTLCCPGIAIAQDVANSFEELRPLLKVGRLITIVDETGTETRGKIVEIARDAFVVASDGAATGQERRSFGVRPLRASVAKRDGLGEGIVLGLLAGLAAAPVVCKGFMGGCDQLTGLAAIAVTVPGGIGVGAVIDHLHRAQEIRVEYLRSSRAAFGTKPLVWSRARGLSVVIEW